MAQHDTEVTVLSAQVPISLRDELMGLAGEHDRSMSAEVRAACRAYVSRSRPDFYHGRGLGRRGTSSPAAPSAQGES